MMAAKSVMAVLQKVWLKVRIEVLEEVEEYPRGRLGILGGDALQRIVADAAAAAHEEHADRAERGPGPGIVAGTARQPERADALALDGAVEMRPTAGGAGGGSSEGGR